MNFVYYNYWIPKVFEELSSEMLKEDGCFSHRISYFTKFKWRPYEESARVGIGDAIIIKIYQCEISHLICEIHVEDATEITEEDLSIINDIVLFLKTRAEESKKEYDADMERAKNENQV